MAKKILFLIVAVIVLIILGFTVLYFFRNEVETTPDLQELMAIIKKSPDYPDFLKVIKSDNFDPKLVSYYNLSPEIYSEKSQELESLKQIIDTIHLNNSSFFVELESKTDSKQGLIAILDMAKRESQVIIANLKIEAGMGL